MDNGAENYRRFLNGDNGGLVEIVREYKDGLIFYLRGFTDDILQAEELAEDTFVRLVTKRPRFNQRSKFKTWLYTIGRNIALDHARRKTRYVEISYGECPEIANEEASLEQVYIQEERSILLHRAMRELKPEYRQILWLVYFEGFTNREAAAIMKRSVHSVETLVYRAKRALRARLDEEDFIYEEL
ncbi:MAG: RNA polymerase sigma factor [Ruminococcaceae bacterium]|nr:RNA polymerase sigma factor [Oscillospiraceae bacterium]